MSDSSAPRRPALLVVLAVIVFLECVALAAATVYLLIGLVSAHPDSYASAIAEVVFTLIAAIWLGVMGVHTLQGRPWIRAGVAVWQFLQIAIGIGTLQGIFAQPTVGWLLIVPAVIALVLLFAPSVVRATRREVKRD